MTKLLLSRGVVMLCACSMLACTSMRVVSEPVPGGPPVALASTLAAGDELKVTRKDGTSTEFVLDRVTASQLVGRGAAAAVDIGDIRSIERRESSPLKTTLLVVGIVLGVVMAAMAQASAALLSAR